MMRPKKPARKPEGKGDGDTGRFPSTHHLPLFRLFAADIEGRFAGIGVRCCQNLWLFLLGLLYFFVAAFVVTLGHHETYVYAC